jgi:hypothetical protein
MTSAQDLSGDDRIRRLEEDVSRLRAENSRLRSELDKLHRGEREGPASSVGDAYDEFVKGEGVLWKRAADGGMESIAYCPKCRLVLLPVPAGHPNKLVCTGCRFEAPFGPGDLLAVAARVVDTTSPS